MKNSIYTREFFVSSRKANLHYAEPALGIEIYFYEINGKPCGMFFAGRAVKPSVQCSFSTPERRETYMQQWINGIRQRHEAQQLRRAARAAFRHTLKEGDLLYTSWGYEQTNIEFFQVVTVKEKSVIVREIAQDKRYTQSMAG